MNGAIFDAVDFGLVLLGADGVLLQANRWVRERCPGAQPVGQPLQQAFASPVEPRLALAVRSCLDFGHSIRLSQAFHPMPLPLYRPGGAPGERLRQAVDVIAVADTQTGQRRCLLQVRDVSDSVRREQLLRTQARQLSTELQRTRDAQLEIERQSVRFREMARLAPVGLFETDPAGHLSYCNARAAEMVGCDPVPLQGQPWPRLLGRAAELESCFQRWQASASTGVRFATGFAHERGGAEGWMRLESTSIRDAGGKVHGHIFTLVDVTELHLSALRNEARANQDALTGLANKEHFERRLRERLARRPADGQASTLLFIDLDRFKSVNDAHGHQAGDMVLKAVAGRLRRCVRSDDVVARMGGDEFAALLWGVDDPGVLHRIAAKVEKAIGLPINIGSCHVRVGASVGLAAVPAEGGDMAALLNWADAAMYQHKRQRAGQVGDNGEVVALQAA